MTFHLDLSQASSSVEQFLESLEERGMSEREIIEKRIVSFYLVAAVF